MEFQAKQYLCAMDFVSQSETNSHWSGVVDEAHDGCFLYLAPPLDVLQQDEEINMPPWLLDVDTLSDGDEDEDEVVGNRTTEEAPDLTLDEGGILSILNSSKVARSYFVTVENCAHVLSAQNTDLLDDRKTGKRFPYLTFIIMLHPRTCVDVVTLVPQRSKKDKKRKKKKSELDMSSIKITSDVQDYTPTLDATALPYDLEVFPLAPPADGDSAGSWLCTQASGGHLTHFAHPSTFHAVDFRCAVGTPVRAIFAARVLEVRREARVTGGHVSNLFSWNSILLQRVVDDSSSESEAESREELFAEYVHIHHEGVLVQEGDVVARGQVICQSGEAGFCPEPHLHLQLSRSRSADAASVPLRFGGEPITAGTHYPLEFKS